MLLVEVRGDSANYRTAESIEHGYGCPICGSPCRCAERLFALATNPDGEISRRGPLVPGVAFVAVGEWVVLHDEVKQVCCFLLNARVQVLAAEGLLHCAENAAERVVGLRTEHHVFRELSCDLVVKLDGGLGTAWGCEGTAVVPVKKLEGW